MPPTLFFIRKSIIFHLESSILKQKTLLCAFICVRNAILIYFSFIFNQNNLYFSLKIHLTHHLSSVDCMAHNVAADSFQLPLFLQPYLASF